jgi:hypothetical protein
LLAGAGRCRPTAGPSSAGPVARIGKSFCTMYMLGNLREEGQSEGGGAAESPGALNAFMRSYNHPITV